MNSLIIIFGYLQWHYGKALLSLSQIWKNFLFFVLDFFSIGQLFKNFFDPWKRMDDSYPKNFNIKEYFYAAITNIIIRIVGMIMRLLFIIIGLICYILLAITYPLAIIFWLILPFIILILLFSGIILLIK